MGGKKKRGGSKVKLEEDVKPDVKQEFDDQTANDDKKSKWRYFGGKSGKKEKERGVVYISCLPHGFYEKQLEGYFGQFGKVTGVYVPKSKKSGRSKGYAYVQFLHPEVAQVAAETMNNYLVFNRLIKTEVVPPDKQRNVMFKQKYKDMKCSTHEDKVRATMKKQRKLVKTVRSEDIINKLRRVQDSLRSMGVEYKMKVAGLREDVQLTNLTPIDPDAPSPSNIKQETDAPVSKKGKKKSKKGSDNTCQAVALPSASLVKQGVGKSKGIAGKKKQLVKEAKENIVSMVQQVRAKRKTTGETGKENTAGKETAAKAIKVKTAAKTVKVKTAAKAVKVKTAAKAVKVKTAAKAVKVKTVDKSIKEKSPEKTGKPKIFGSIMKSRKSSVALVSPVSKKRSKVKLETTV